MEELNFEDISSLVALIASNLDLYYSNFQDKNANIFLTSVLDDIKQKMPTRFEFIKSFLFNLPPSPISKIVTFNEIFNTQESLNVL